MVKFAAILDIEPYELFKPADTPAPSVSILFTKYNDEVTKAVNTSLKQFYDYFQAQFD